MDYLDTLSHFASSLDYSKLEPQVQDQVGWILADTVAAMAAGSAEPELRAIAKRQAAGTPHHSALLIGLGQKSTPEAAAFINGTSGTFLEMDEGNGFLAAILRFMSFRLLWRSVKNAQPPQKVF